MFDNRRGLSRADMWSHPSAREFGGLLTTAVTLMGRICGLSLVGTVCCILDKC